MPVPEDDARAFLIGLLVTRLGPPKTRYKDDVELIKIFLAQSQILLFAEKRINGAKWHNVKLSVASVSKCTTIGDLVKLIAREARAK
jgi:hypothetical protein